LYELNAGTVNKTDPLIMCATEGRSEE